MFKFYFLGPTGLENHNYRRCYLPYLFLSVFWLCRRGPGRAIWTPSRPFCPLYWTLWIPVTTPVGRMNNNGIARINTNITLDPFVAAIERNHKIVIVILLLYACTTVRCGIIYERATVVRDVVVSNNSFYTVCACVFSMVLHEKRFNFESTHIVFRN
jgi:hypothetical protein